MLFKNIILPAFLALPPAVYALPAVSPTVSSATVRSIPSTTVASALPTVSAVNPAKYDNKGRMINAAGERIRLEYADQNRTIVNAFGQTYNATDILSVEYFMAQPDTPEVADKF